MFVCSYAQIDTLSLSYVLLTLPVFMMLAITSYFCCVMQNDKTPLYLASFRGHTEIVAMLLKFGADLSSCDTVSPSYFITPISAVSDYIDVYIYTYIPSAHTCAVRVTVLGLCVCLSPLVLVLHTGTKPAHE